MDLGKRARDYGRAIILHSLRSATDSLHSGQNYSSLAHLLGGTQGLQHLTGSQHTSSPNDKSIAVLYDLGTQDEHSTAAFKCTKFSDDEYILFSNMPRSEQPIGQLLFLRGFLSAEWIQTIGARYRVDPDFFQRHLSFASRPIYESVFALPTLPSSTRNIIEIPMTTITCRDLAASIPKQSGLQEQQAEATIAMDRYFRKFMSWAKPRDSIVRGFKILNERFNIIEQDISICLEKDGKGWVAIVWLDSGETLQKSPHGPWMDDRHSSAESIVALPIQQYLKHVALKTMGDFPSSDTRSDGPSPNQHSIQQSSTHLPLQYCRFLEQTIASTDFIFATADIFRFAAHSEVQCFNLIASLIDETVSQGQSTNATSPVPAAELTHSLLEYKSILDRHRGRLQETLLTLLRRDQSGWPRTTKEPYRRKALHEASRLEEDYRYLVLRAQELATKCQDSMAILMNDAVIVEAQKAMEQTERMKKLTMLATFFIPLSFTSTMFGMNIRQFGIAGTLSIWVWVAVTVPVVFLTVLSYAYEMDTIKKGLASMRGKWHG